MKLPWGVLLALGTSCHPWALFSWEEWMRQAGYPLQGPKIHLHPSPQLQTASLCHPWASKALGRPA